MDLTPFLAQLRADHALAVRQLQGQRLMLCLRSHVAICAVVGALSEAARLVAVTTCATDALALVARHRPDLLLLSDVLQQGCGVDLACDVKRLHPATRVLLVLTRPGSGAGWPPPSPPVARRCCATAPSGWVAN